VQFCEKYNIEPSGFYMSRLNSQFPKDVCYYIDRDDILYVDEQYFIRRKEFKKKVINFNQDFYYLLEEHMSDAAIAELITIDQDITKTSAQVFLNTRLWRLDTETILSTKVSKINWAMYRIGHWFLNRINRYKRDKIDIGSILDDRTTRS
jgi:hypothetical protein